MLSLYLHIPFCVSKCPYCGFFSTRYDAVLADRYLQALREELKRLTPSIGHRSISTIYIGGGTPTVLGSEQLSFLFENIVREAGNIMSGAEITVEANPWTVSRDLLVQLKELGATRLSIGVQSFSDKMLAVLGRVHRAGESRLAVTLARAAGFANMGLDLIYGIPGQTAEDWEATLKEAVALGPEHLSLYSLSLDEGSRFSDDARRGKIVLPSDETTADQYSSACDLLERNGYDRYELSNFARPGFSCRHNLNYWARGEYLGIGAGAWSFLDGVRSTNVADIGGYIDRISKRESVRSFEERPGLSEAAAETLFLGLRTTAGVDLERFAASFGSESHAALVAAIGRHRSKNLYEVIGGTLRLTRRGTLLANDAMEALLP